MTKTDFGHETSTESPRWWDADMADGNHITSESGKERRKR